MNSLNDWLKSINKTKQDVMDSPEEEKNYNPYIVNRCLGGFIDTVIQANEMNMFPGLDKRMQYDYLRHSIRPKNRFAPWIKPEVVDNLEIVKKFFGYNTSKAEEALKILSNSDLEYIKQTLESGKFNKIKTPAK